MFKRSLWIALGLVALVVFFTVMPTGTNASDVLDGYQNTLVSHSEWHPPLPVHGRH